jgi:hypothetical protein
MRTPLNALVAIAAPLALAVPAFAADAAAPPKPPAAKTCLQNNRIYTWRVVNTRELIVGDVENNVFTVHLGGGCIALNNSVVVLNFIGKTDLGCLERGDRVSYRAPGLGRLTCFITDVHPGLEPRPGAKEAPQSSPQ